MKALLLAGAAAAGLLAAGLADAPAPPLPLVALVPGAVVTQPFGCTVFSLEPFDPRCPGGHFHSGIDLAAPAGTPVQAAAAGLAHVVPGGPYGLHVFLRHDARTQTLYAHLSVVLVSEGASVVRGQVVGFVGSTGNSTGPHLHFEVRLDGYATDPVRWLSG